MKVKELIEELEALDGEMPVVIPIAQSGRIEWCRIRSVELKDGEYPVVWIVYHQSPSGLSYD